MGRKPRKAKPGNPRTAVAYLRVSTDRDRQQLGLSAQKHAIEAWASKEGVSVVAWHTEEVSGGASIDKRPILMEAVADVLEHRAGRLVFSTLDRFSRDPLTAVLVETELARAGAELTFADGSGNGDDPTSEMIRTIRLATAKYERRMIGARIKAALKVKQRRGEMTGQAPFGWRAVPGPMRAGKDGRERPIAVLEPSPEEQAVIDQVRSLRADGHSLRAIVDELSTRGFVGRAGKPLQLRSVANIVRHLTSTHSAV